MHNQHTLYKLHLLFFQQFSAEILKLWRRIHYAQKKQVMIMWFEESQPHPTVALKVILYNLLIFGKAPLSAL